MLPVPVRKWFVKKIIEKAEKSQKNPPVNEPLSAAQKQKFQAQSQQASNVVKPESFLGPMRNKK